MTNTLQALMFSSAILAGLGSFHTKDGNLKFNMSVVCAVSFFIGQLLSPGAL